MEVSRDIRYNREVSLFTAARGREMRVPGLASWAVCTLSLSVLAVAALADVRSVPSVYTSIQSAIDAAENGDTVIVEPNTYYENIDFLGKAISLTSTDPCDDQVVAATIIDGSYPDDPNFGSVVTFNSTETNASILTGFTIRGGTGSWLLVSWEFKGLNWNRCGGGGVVLKHGTTHHFS